MLDHQDALFREYEKTIELWIDEGRSAWELVSIYMAVQVGLASVFAFLFTQNSPNFGSLRYSSVFLAGIFSSLAWFLILYRARMRRENWFFLGLRMERELRDRGVFRDRDHRFNIFEVENAVRNKRLALESFKDRCCKEEEIRFRHQRWYEKLGALWLAHVSISVIGIVWLILFAVLSLLPSF